MRLVRFICALIGLATVTSGCILPTNGVYRGGTEDGDRIHYFSFNEPAFEIAFPGTDWVPRSLHQNHLVLKAPQKQVNIFQYREGLFSQRLYKSGASEEDALLEYYRIESTYHISRAPGIQGEIRSRNLPDIPQPNLLWKVHGPNLPSIFFLTTSQNHRFLSVSWQDTERPDSGEKQLVDVFRSFKFLSQDDITRIQHRGKRYYLKKSN